MAQEITMPALGESVTEGTITIWLKRVGDTVAVDEPIVEVATDKVDTEVPSPIAGVLTKIVAHEDDTVDVGSVIAYVGESSEVSGNGFPGDGAPELDVAPELSDNNIDWAPPVAERTPASPLINPSTPLRPSAPERESAVPLSSTPASAAPASAAADPLPAPTPVQAPTPASDSTATYVTPIVRKLAKELGVDLAQITGTGVGGRIRRHDVESAAQRTCPTPPVEAALEPSATPLATPPRTAHTQQASLVIEIDITDGPGDYLPVVLRATASALAYFPALNTGCSEPAFGVALTATRGAFMPVLHNLTSKTPEDIRTEIITLTHRAQQNQIGPDDLIGSTFSVMDDTAQAIMLEIPQIPPQQVAALAVGPATERAGVVDGHLAVRRTFYLSLSYDSSVADANVAVEFLNAVKKSVERV